MSGAAKRMSMSFGSRNTTPFALQRTASTNSMNPDVELPEDDDKINEMYEQVLDSMLTAPQIKEQLMETQSMDKKRQMVKMHNQIFISGWGDNETMLLNVIQKSKVPDIQSLSSLKLSLKSANKEFMNSFLEAGGIAILLKAIENRLHKNPITELDIAILYEILSCCKAVMNNTTGMEGFLSVNGAIDTIARSLNFDYKLYALLVLEMLSVCCYYSDKAALQVVEGMKHYARTHREAPFASLSVALIQQDIEVKASVVQFVNSMVMGVADLNARTLLRNDLNCQLFGERYDDAVKSVEAEIKLLQENDLEAQSAGAKSATPQSKLKRKSMISLHGIRAYNEKKVDAIIKNSNLLAAISEEGSIVGNNIEVKWNKQSIYVNPLQGTMAGLLMAAKNTEKLESKFINVLGGKKTKRRWYELDKDNFKWCAGHEKESEYKGNVSVSTITDIRPFTTDSNILESSPHAFEIETTDRTLAFGCETSTDKDSWVSALETCRDNYVMTKGAYKLQFRELTTADVVMFTEMLKKQGLVYHSIAAEDKKAFVSSNGLDLSDSLAVSRFLQCETLAAGTNAKLLSILQELLVIPSGSDGTWDAIHTGVRKLREASGRDARAGTAVFSDQLKLNMVETLNSKAADSGSAYSQVSKLALSTIASEQEASRLGAKVHDLEEALERLAKEKEQIEANIAVLAEQKALAMGVRNINIANNNSSNGNSSNNDSINNSNNTSFYNSSGGISNTNSSEQAANITGNSSSNNNNSSSDSGNVNVAAATVTAVAPSVVVNERFAKYDKMRKMLPEGAVRQKMTTDGFSAEEIDMFFDGTLAVSTAPVSAGAGTTVSVSDSAGATVAAQAPAVDERFAKYDKMRKMLPEGAVRQKMASDGFDPTVIDQYFNGELPAVAPPAAAPSVSLAPVADERFAKYDKMRKMLPEGAVRQKMTGDGFSTDEIDRYFAGEVMTVAAPVAAAPVADPRFEKYDKMRKMLPEGAVRQKMTGDGFSPDEIDRYFSGEMMTVAAAPAAAAPVADPRFEKYDKMRKMLPEGAVRQKMTGDGFSADEIDRFFAGEVMTVAAAPAAAAPVADPRFEKYEKMRKMLPEGAVRQKMTGDGFTPQEIDRFFAGEVMTVAAAPAVPAAPAPMDPRFEKYDKMRKLLPEGAVRQKMSGDGFTPQEIEKFFNPSAPAMTGIVAAVMKPKPAVPVVESPPEGMTAKPKVVPTMKLKGVFWTKLKASEVPGTVWHKLRDHKLSNADTQRLEEWFAAKVAEPSAADKAAAAAKASAAASQPKVVSVLDGKRTQNVLLIIGKLKKDPKGLLDMVVAMDPAVLTQEMTSMLFGILPTPEELTAVKDYKEAQLDAASKIIFQFNRIPRLQQRMECHDIAFTWFNNANVIVNQLGVIQTACAELSKSQKPMESILAIVLAIGNYINGDTARGQAYGVRLDIFMKMSNLKAALPSQGSLMHYLALVAEATSQELVTLPDSWIGIAAAAEVSFKQITTDFNQLDNQVNKMNAEFTRIKDTKENIGLDGVLEDSRGPCTSPLHKRLDKFLREAKPKVSSMKELTKNVETTVESLMNKYGESLKALSEEDPTKKFFSLISTFGRQFASAYDDNRLAREVAEKAARALAEAEAKKNDSSKGAAATATGATATPNKPKKPTDNIFGNFHKSQTGSSDDVLEEFKRKMLARQQK